MATWWVPAADRSESMPVLPGSVTATGEVTWMLPLLITERACVDAIGGVGRQFHSHGICVGEIANEAPFDGVTAELMRGKELPPTASQDPSHYDVTGTNGWQ